MNIILTGGKGAGKTTVCLKFAELLKKNGIATGGVICRDGMIYDLTGSSRKFYVPQKSKEAVSVGRYHINISALDFGCRAIEGARESARVIFIDEFGRLEVDREGLYRGVTRALATERALVVVRKSLLCTFKSFFPQYGFSIFEVTPENRDAVPKMLLTEIKKRANRDAGHF